MATRRAVLGVMGAGLLAACTPRQPAQFVDPAGPEVAAAELARRPGTVREVSVAAAAGDVDLGGLTVPTWSYDGAIPGRPIRVTAGEQIRATVHNRLPVPTTVHWHGLTLRNDADGVPDVTQPAIEPGGRFVYQFTASRPGTYWFHPHHGLQLDRGLYAPLIVDDPHEPLGYDREWVIVLDDWLDGVAGTPEQAYARLRTRRGMGMMGAAAEPVHPYPLFNGRLPTDPEVFSARPGDRVRLRIVNAAATTAFRIGVAGHGLTLTHTDGQPIVPFATDTVLVAMGERYDALVTMGSGAFPVVAATADGTATASGLIRTAAGQAPEPAVSMLGERAAVYADLRAAEAVRLPDRAPHRRLRISLTGGMMAYDWRFDGRTFDPDRIDHAVRAGERVEIAFVNATMMWHPVHLHGHVFAIGGPAQTAGPVKDTAVVAAGGALRVRFDADNPGRWMIHCHNAYHAEAGMMTLLGYQR